MSIKTKNLQLRYKEDYWKHSIIARFVATLYHGIPIANYHVIENLSLKMSIRVSICTQTLSSYLALELDVELENNNNK
jgi:hypothetical protein